MDYLILHQSDNTENSLHSVLSDGPLSEHSLIDSIIKAHPYLNDKSLTFAYDISNSRKIHKFSHIKSFSEESPLRLNHGNSASDRIIISNARYLPEFDSNIIESSFRNANADILAIELDPDLTGFREKFIFDSNRNIAGIRRVFSDTIVPTSLPKQWPHLIYIHKDSLERCANITHLPADYDNFISLCTRNSLTIKSLRVAGNAHDLYESTTFLQFIDQCLEHNSIDKKKPAKSDKTAKLFGNIIYGKNVNIGKNCIIVGPSIIGDQITIPDNTVIKNSIILSQPEHTDKIVENILLTKTKNKIQCNSDNIYQTRLKRALFRDFSEWSYPKIWKRLADIIFAFAFLLASIPVFIAVAIAIKVSSPGPVFFKHKRQGLHGKEFGCTKFRTMIVGADDIQDQLRKINEVDGPQFKMDDDPRVNAIGKFLRDTGIDEFPQFINVLMGQMSVVGPRPSPEKENAFCAYWRDARLSVRPGITGLWQVKRTRQEGRDFQEWVIHDTSYVKNISPWLDIKICFMTVKYLLKSFIEQF